MAMSADTETTPAGPLDLKPLSGRQLGVLVLALMLGMLDGYDALAMAFTAPAVGREWGLDKAVLGLLLSSGLIGMAFGSLVLSPLADRVGRRPVVLGALALMTSGSLLSGFAGATAPLFACRVLTGLGIGVMVAMTTLISAEFANARHRPLAIAVVATSGFPLGGVVGGLTASALLPTLGWPWVFLVGAISSGVLLVAAAILLPESPGYLAALRSPDALGRLNRALVRLGHSAVATLPAASDHDRAGYRALFAPGMAAVTIRLAAVIVLVSSSAYYLLNWIPQFVTDMGFSNSTGSRVSAFSNLIGVPGGAVAGACAARFRPGRLASVVMIGMGLSVAAFGFTPARLPLVMLSAGLFGFFLSASVAANYGLIAATFPPLTRAAGVGLTLGAGRIASAIGPALAGMFLGWGVPRGEVSLGFAVGPVIAAAIVASLLSRAAPLAFQHVEPVAASPTAGEA